VIEPSIEPAIEQAEPEPVAAAAEKKRPERTSARVRHVGTRGSAGERFANGGLRADGGRGGRAFRNRGTNFNSGMVAGAGATAYRAGPACSLSNCSDR